MKFLAAVQPNEYYSKYLNNIWLVVK